MSKQDGFRWGLAGVLVWACATVAFVNLAGGRIEPTPWGHTFNTLLAGAALGLFFPITARVRRAPRRDRAMAALAFSAPGLVAAAVLAVNAAALLPQLSAEALARYVAVALAAYVLVLAQAVERPVRPA